MGNRRRSMPGVRWAASFILGCATSVGCGARVDQTSLDTNTGASASNEPLAADGMGAAATNHEDNTEPVSPDFSLVTLLSPASMECHEVAPIYQAHIREVQEGQAFLAGSDPDLPPPVESSPPTPCGGCMAACSITYDSACGSQDECVKRHCSCDDCFSRIPAGDVCRCAATCMAPRDQRCLDRWLEYAACLTASCQDVCPV